MTQMPDGQITGSTVWLCLTVVVVGKLTVGGGCDSALSEPEQQVTAGTCVLSCLEESYPYE